MKSTLLSALHTSEDILLSFFDKPIKTQIKEGKHSIVTTADLEAESAIIGTIRARFPKHNILSEEAGFLDNHSTYTWVIDPLDGSSNFAAGIPWFGTMITLFEDNQPVMAGASLPANGDIFYAELGKLSLKNGRPLQISASPPLDESLAAFSNDPVNDPALLKKSLACYRFLLKNARNIRSTNCLLDFLYVAEGRFSCVVNLCTRIWDIAAMSLLIPGSGGTIRTLDNQAITYLIASSTLSRNYSVMAGTYDTINLLGTEFALNK